MKKELLLSVILVCVIGHRMFADYSFSFMSYADTCCIRCTLLTPTNGNGPPTVSGGSLAGDCSRNSRTILCYLLEIFVGRR